MRFSILLFVSLIFIFSNCNDIIEVDISEKMPVVIMPQAGSVVPEFTSFSWEKLEGARSYRLQIRTPEFFNPVAISYDTITTKTTINLLLSAGQYEYTLTALNNGYVSLPAGPYAITTDTIEGGQTQISLSFPSSTDFYSGEFEGPFTWSSVPNASFYEFSLREGTNYATGNIVHSENNITSTSIFISDLELATGQYIWGVSALYPNGSTTSTFTKTFNVDATAPLVPSLINPANESTVFVPINFSWSNPQDVGSVQSPVFSVIQISSDPNFNTVLDEHVSSSESYQSTSVILPGTYFWRVKAIDEAGNESDYSVVREFYIN